MFGTIDGCNLKERQGELAKALREASPELKAKKLTTFIQEEQNLLMGHTPPLQRSQALDTAKQALRKLEEILMYAEN